MFRYPLELRIAGFEVPPSWGTDRNSAEPSILATGESDSSKKQRKAPPGSAAHKLNEIIHHTLGNTDLGEAEKFKALLETLNGWIHLDNTNFSLSEKKQAIEESILNKENLRKIVSNPRFKIEMQGQLLETNLTNLQEKISDALKSAQDSRKAEANLPLSDFMMQRNISESGAKSLRTALKGVIANNSSMFSLSEQKTLLSKIIDEAINKASGEASEGDSRAFNKALIAGLREHEGKFTEKFLQETTAMLDSKAELIGTVGMIRNFSHGEALAGRIAGGTNDDTQNKTEAFAKFNEREKAWSEAQTELTAKLKDEDKPAAIKKITAEGNKFLSDLHGMIAAGTIDLNTEAGHKQIQALVSGIKNQHVKTYVEFASTKAIEANEVKATSNDILKEYGLNLDQIIGKGVAAVALLAIFKSILGGGGAARQLLANGVNPLSGLAHKGIGLILISGILQHTGILGESKNSGANALLEKLAA